MEIHVGQQRRCTAALGRARLTPCPRPILQHASVEPFLNQSHDAPVCNPVLEEFHQPSVVEGMPSRFEIILPNDR